MKLSFIFLSWYILFCFVYGNEADNSTTVVVSNPATTPDTTTVMTTTVAMTTGIPTTTAPTTTSTDASTTTTTTTTTPATTTTTVAPPPELTDYVFGSKYLFKNSCYMAYYDYAVVCAFPLQSYSWWRRDIWPKTLDFTGVSFSNMVLYNLTKDALLPGRSFEKLTRVAFRNTSIIAIEDGMFDDMISLETLIITGNNLSQISENVFTEQLGFSLTTLELSNNNLSMSLENLKNLERLRSLDLSYNSEIFKRSNQIFPSALEKLRTLDLSYCNVQQFNEETFKLLSRLQTLTLRGNPLSAIPAFISKLQHLQSLNMGNTSIAVIKYVKNVKHDELEELSFTDCLNLTSVKDCAFCNFPRLKKISFSRSSNLSNIHENAFGHISAKTPLKIKQFFMSHCNVSYFSEKMLDWEIVDRLHIDNNPYKCDCSMSWLIDDLRGNYSDHRHKLLSEYEYWGTSKRIEPLTCAAPYLLKGQLLHSLNDSYCNRTAESKPVVTTGIVLFTFVLVLIILTLAGALGYWLYKNGYFWSRRVSSGMQKLQEDFDHEIDA